MTKSNYRCGSCGLIGAVQHNDDCPLVEILSSISEDHDRRSPACSGEGLAVRANTTDNRKPAATPPL